MGPLDWPCGLMMALPIRSLQSVPHPKHSSNLGCKYGTLANVSGGGGLVSSAMLTRPVNVSNNNCALDTNWIQSGHAGCEQKQQSSFQVHAFCVGQISWGTFRGPISFVRPFEAHTAPRSPLATKGKKVFLKLRLLRRKKKTRQC